MKKNAKFNIKINLKHSLESSWKKALANEFEKDYMIDLQKFLAQELNSEKTIYPEPKNYFKAFEKTPFKDVKLVILGQDPYHGPLQAHGLSFSVPKGIKPPPSLKNIFKEIKAELGENTPLESGCLESWAEQGVLLLNSVLSVEQGKAASHQKKGWETFTDSVLQSLNREKRPIVYMLWGSYAHKKGEFLNNTKHLVLKAPHPSPLSSYRGFFGCDHFKKANEFLEQNDLTVIDWSVH